MNLKTEILKATYRGSKEKGFPNQDYYLTKETKEYLILTISDGLGSAKHSLDGAKVACLTVLEILKKRLSGLDIKYLSSTIVSKWTEKISNKTENIEDFRTTNLFALVLKKNKQIITGQLGDGMIAIRMDNQDINTVSIEKDFLNETNSLGSGYNENYIIKNYNYQNSYELFLATDGISDDIETKNLPLLFDYFKKKYENVDKRKRNSEIRKELKITMKDKFSDDKSLIFAWAKKYENECN